MKKVLTLVALIGVMAANQCFAIWVNVNRHADYYKGNGGEFTVTAVNSADTSFANILAHYDADARLGNGFETFCMNTGLSLLGNPLDASTSPAGVTLGTAWLYSQFASGSLAGYNYVPGTGRAQSAYELQNAIWRLQGQAFSTAASTTFYNAAVAALGADVSLAANGAFGVDKLNMLNRAGATSQPMLALVPDGGMTIMLLGMAFTGLACFSRRIKA